MHSMFKQRRTIKGNFEDGFFIYQCKVLSRVHQKCVAHSGGDTENFQACLHLKTSCVCRNNDKASLIPSYFRTVQERVNGKH